APPRFGLTGSGPGPFAGKCCPRGTPNAIGRKFRYPPDVRLRALPNTMHRTPKRRSPMPRPTLRTRRRPDSTVKLHVEALEDRALLSAWHFDFGTPTSPAAAGYTAVPVVLYDANVGYGWQSVTGITAVNCGTSDPLTRDFHQAHDGTFQANVENGIYEV